MKIVAISGSLRKGSRNTAVLRAAARLLPLPGTARGEKEILRSPELAEPLREAMTRLSAAIRSLQTHKRTALVRSSSARA